MPQTRPPGGRSGAARRRIRALIPGKEGKRLIDRHIPSASIRTPPSPSWGGVGVGGKQRFDLYAHHRAAPDLGMAQQRRSQALYPSTLPAEVLLATHQTRRCYFHHHHSGPRPTSGWRSNSSSRHFTPQSLPQTFCWRCRKCALPWRGRARPGGACAP